MKTNTILELIEEIRQGNMIILVDDEDRENEGDLVMAASKVTPQDINFMAAKARGLICLTLTEEACQRLELPLMQGSSNSQGQGTNFTYSIEAASGVTTGISAADRAHTIRTAAARSATAKDIVRPGHVFPVMAKSGGVLYRAGHTEAGCDLTRLAGVEPAAVIVEIMNEDGSMARRQDLEKFAEHHQLKIGTIADLIEYRNLHEKTVERIRTESLETEYGDFVVHFYKDRVDQSTHMALVKCANGVDAEGVCCFDQAVPLVRVHIADPFRDLLAVKVNHQSGWNISKALKRINEAGEGVLVLLAPSFDSKDLIARANAFFAMNSHENTQEQGSGGYRTIGTGSQILRDLGVQEMRLMSRLTKFNALSGFGLKIVEYIHTDD